MKISKEIYDKMVLCNNQSSKVMFITKIIEDYLTKKGVDVQLIRDNDDGGYVDMIDYGRRIISKQKLEKLFEHNKLKWKDTFRAY